MKNSDLLDNFINALYNKIEKRSDLVSFIADTLKIENGSASRRLNKKVYFSVREMGILAYELGISLDGILNFSCGYTSTPSYSLHLPKSVESMKYLEDTVEKDLKLLDNLIDQPTEYGFVINTLPIEWVVRYKNLLKLSYFKWGYYYVGSDEFSNYSTWQIPPKLLSLSDKILEIYKKMDSITYIWDISTIWCLVKDMKYFHDLQALDLEDVESIKLDLHKMLHDVEKMLNGSNNMFIDSNKVQIYSSTVHIGGQLLYFLTKDKRYSSFHTYFLGSSYSDDYDTCIQIRNWINSMKKVCTLISNSGAKERKLFFDEQHKIVDSI